MTKKRKIDDMFSKYLENMRMRSDDRNIFITARKELRKCVRAQSPNTEEVKFLTQGSFQYGTINRPCWPPAKMGQVGQQMDLDDGVYFSHAALKRLGVLHAPDLLLDYVHNCIKDLCARKGWLLSDEKPSCVRAIVSADKHVDIPVYSAPEGEMSQISNARAAAYKALLGMEYYPGAVDSEKIFLAHREKGWISSDPRKIIDWVIDRVEERGEHYLDLCRILKGWRDSQWKQGAPLSSILIMAMVDQAMEVGMVTADLPREDALLQITRVLEEVMNCGVRDPGDNSGKMMTGGLTDSQKRDCADRFNSLYQVLFNAMHGQSEGGHANALKNIFGKHFPGDPSLIVPCAVKAAAVITTTSPKIAVARTSAQSDQ